MLKQDYTNIPVVQRYLKASSDLILLLVDRGLMGIETLLEEKYFTETNTGLLFIIRNYIAQLDSLPSIVLLPAPESLQILTRTLFEASCYIEFIIEKDTSERALAFQVYYLRERINTLEKFDPTTNRGKEFLVKVRKDRIFSEFDIPDVPVASLVNQYLNKLSTAPYASMNERFLALKGKRDWFTTVGGGKDFISLCEYLGHHVSYEVFYRGWSGIVHSSSTIHEGLLRNGNFARFEKLRSMENVQRTVNSVLSMTMDLYEKLFKKTSATFYERLVRFMRNQYLPKKNYIDSFNFEITSRNTNLTTPSSLLAVKPPKA